jgi:hypothetical protein
MGCSRTAYRPRGRGWLDVKISSYKGSWLIGCVMELVKVWPSLSLCLGSNKMQLVWLAKAEMFFLKLFFWKKKVNFVTKYPICWSRRHFKCSSSSDCRLFVTPQWRHIHAAVRTDFGSFKDHACHILFTSIHNKVHTGCSYVVYHISSCSICNIPDWEEPWGSQSDNDSTRASFCGLNKDRTYSNTAILREKNRTFQNRCPKI